MSNIKISKKDLIWSYITQFFQMASGLITLPLILKMLSEEEIGLNYLMLTISSLIALFDFGFAPQFGRNITYLFSGAQELKKEGIIHIPTDNKTLNYKLIATMICVAKDIYKKISLLAFVVSITLGTLYIYHTTNGFTTVENALLIWVIYSISIYFNLYFTYYSSLLTGRGLIKEQKKAMLVSRITYILLAYLLVISGFSLIGVVIANFISPFVGRYISHHYFYTNSIKKELKKYTISREEKKETFNIIWHNAKKLGIMFLGAYAVNKSGMFIAGLFLSLETIASYGLLIQLTTIITTISMMYTNILQPQFANYRINKRETELLKIFSSSLSIFYILFIAGSLFLIFVMPHLLLLLKSNAQLPSLKICILFLIVCLLENNHSAFSSLIVSNNQVPFVKSSLISGFSIIIGSFLILQYTDLGLWGIIFIQFICQLAYSNWKWPYVVCKELKISFFNIIKLGINTNYHKIKLYINERYK